MITEEEKKKQETTTRVITLVVMGIVALGVVNKWDTWFPDKPNSTTAAPVGTGWSYVQAWGDNVDKNTEPFIITGSRFKISWNLDVIGNGGPFSIDVRSVERGKFADLIVNDIFRDNKSGETIIYESGEFYLDVGANDLNWTIKVEELK